MVRMNHNTVRFSFLGYNQVLPEFISLFMEYFSQVLTEKTLDLKRVE